MSLSTSEHNTTCWNQAVEMVK
uniref:Cdpk1 n=1 Tax=Arundo donax TaxID=35708 RepID=A0A0A9G4E7_ARUDO